MGLRTSTKERRGQFSVLDMTAHHGIAAARLPPHHRDPFDRMLMAQATLDELTLVTGDRQVQRYDVPVLKVVPVLKL